MADLEPWPPEPIHTDRVVLRQAELENAVPEIPGNRPGVFAVEREGVFIGTVTFVRRDRERPGHVRPEGGEIEVGYLFLPAAWGFGYASEAIGAALDWATHLLPGEPVVLCTQSANTASVRLARRLGFVEVERFEEYGTDQWFGSRSALMPSD